MRRLRRRSLLQYEPIRCAVQNDRLPARGLGRPDQALVGKVREEPRDEDHDVIALRLHFDALAQFLEKRGFSDGHRASNICSVPKEVLVDGISGRGALSLADEDGRNVRALWTYKMAGWACALPDVGAGAGG